ncbi:oligopeptide ABC transporter (oligopeptide-binding protein) [Halalkalibacterium halodurans C-125]|uniref:Oligopeptide ABC transporter (Oligopeptide-binding protein) n=1 Tax=Halalkalibacterium halodurans (strain ATCC BAA-125 / DSM 18197 / FERM 7344 / JCM 9153 / C-125) TaxID=272558 RepID=Q9KGM7_HALH5|nr:glutathione ABC transporter substrate-binding protein [Halalkalibacterium halodurans]BAB03750.1 oligopeptide ABC transporter (oligopeptide-binding protein) [Halalkalibacterium halodurans C-125]
MKVSKNSFLFWALALMLTVVLAACASEPNEGAADPETDEGQGTEAPAEAGGDLVIAQLSDVVSLDPAGSNDTPSSDVQANIYETLVVTDQDMELHPGLATEWNPIDDTTWEFKLREGVKFHDDTDFNAEVVKANLERILDPEVASPRAFLYDMITDIEVVDDYTVHITTEFPFAPLPAHLAHNGGGMVSLEAIEADYAAMEEGKDPGSYINENPTGTGYFKFDDRVPDQYVRLVRNDDYWDGTALLDSVTFKVVGEDLTRIAELETGDSHISNPLSPSDVSRVEATEGMHVHRQDSMSLSYIGFNLDKEPFDDVRVRQAISMAIDKSQIIDGIYDGVGVPAIGPLAPGTVGYDDTVSGLDHDIEKAKELLAEAGYEDGFSTTLWTNDNRERVDAATNVQAQLKEIGIDVEIEVLEWGTYLENTANGEHDMFVLGWSTVTGDADYGLYALFHSSQVGEPGNRTFLKDDELDELLDKARRETDEETRLALYHDVQEKLVELAPMLYIHHQQYLLGVRDEVKNLEQSPTQILQLKDVYIEQ